MNLDRAIALVEKEMARGRGKRWLLERFPGQEEIIEEAVEIIRCRKKARGRFSKWDRMFFDTEGVRYATPEDVARYVARSIRERMEKKDDGGPSGRRKKRGFRVADVACGVGGQLIGFGLEEVSAVGVELCEKRALYARKNLRVYGLNTRVLVGDSLSPKTVLKIGKVDVVFCDPARPSSEKKRLLNPMAPDLGEVADRYSLTTDRFVFQIPPHTSHVEITRAGFPGGKNGWEREYVVRNGEVSRLNLYSPPLRVDEASVVFLEGGRGRGGRWDGRPLGRLYGDMEEGYSYHDIFEWEEKSGGERAFSSGAMPFPGAKDVVEGDLLVETSVAFVLARLVNRLREHLEDVFGTEVRPVGWTKRRLFFSAGDLFSGVSPESFVPGEVLSPFILGIYRVLSVGPPVLDWVRSEAKKLGGGKITPRVRVSPGKYWEMRKEMEGGLVGARHLYLFCFGKKRQIKGDEGERGEVGGEVAVLAERIQSML